MPEELQSKRVSEIPAQLSEVLATFATKRAPFGLTSILANWVKNEFQKDKKIK